MSKEGRNVPHFYAKEDLEGSRHKCCWVAILSLSLLTVNSIVCIHLARRLAYVEGQLAKQGVSASEETLTEGMFGSHTKLEIHDGAKIHLATAAGSKMKEHRPYNGPALPSSPREHENRKKRSETKAKDAIEDVKLIYQEYIGGFLGLYQIEGDLTVKVGGRWFHVCISTFGRQEARVACEHLYDIFLYSPRRSKGHDGLLWSPVVSCEGEEWDFRECRMVATNASCEDGQAVRLSCSTRDLFRLSGGQKPNEGRVEFRRGGSDWGTICKKGWDIHDADVLCRHLGYKGAVLISTNFGPGSGPIFLSDVRCTGNESTILGCPHKYRDNDCEHEDDVGVVCDVDECNSNPCQNRGTCIDGVEHYKCQCVRGWVGIHCEMRLCDSNPCHNNGTCIDGLDHYICQCASGWVGVQCEMKEELSTMEVTSRDWSHIEADSDSTGDTHIVKWDDTVLTKQWEKFDPSDKFRFNSGILTVLEEGDYYIYSQVYYWYSNKMSPAISYSVMVADKGNPYRFLTCWKYMEETDPWNTCYTAGVIHLFSNNSVYLHMRCDGCVIKLDHDATFFGVMKLSNARGQHKGLDMNMHGEKSSSDGATPDKVEDVPPTVVRRDQSGKSRFEKLMKSNFRTILNELPNGTRYRVTRRGKIVLR
ncbi:PRSS12 [Branchiostoma lanceolatum]|uniref:Soluble scavenger receptor cysteine-rich domain-containing protein SSC5D n=1 Tax=Branchiostoma lanceolatum TaxID=7740 RepID=A0A8J9Z6R6_BRALA|nr:PRSS12 [Branchiostoma lanceolatum]